MSLTKDDRHDIFSGALARWADRLAVGTPWEQVEAEILTSCHGRIDLLTQMLIQAETQAVRPDAGPGRTAGRSAVKDARQERWSTGRSVRRVAMGQPVEMVLWQLPRRATS